MNRKVKTLTLPDPEHGRVIVISDIHGNLSLYKALLQKVKYQKNLDRLILLGDLMEKGTENLALLRYVMKQTKEEQVYCIMGNCDFVAKNVLYSYRLAFLRSVLEGRKNSLIHEMASQIKISYEDMDMSLYCQKLRSVFLEELAFLNDLPHVIETPSYIFAHSAIENEETFGHDFREVMAMPLFLNRNVHFHKPVVVGHMPVSEYCSQIASFDPIYDPSMNVYSIDGGNMVKQAGQLNALIIEGNLVESVHVEDKPIAYANKTVDPGIQIPFFINWNQGEIEILEEGPKQVKVFSKHLNRVFWIDKAFILKTKDSIKGTDFTNYQMPLKKGEPVHIVFAYDDKVQIKKHGQLGWAYQADLDQSSR